MLGPRPALFSSHIFLQFIIFFFLQHLPPVAPPQLEDFELNPCGFQGWNVNQAHRFHIRAPGNACEISSAQASHQRRGPFAPCGATRAFKHAAFPLAWRPTRMLDGPKSAGSKPLNARSHTVTYQADWLFGLVCARARWE